MKKWLLVSDLDGTLIAGPRYIPEPNFRALESWRQAGGLFAFATGRGWTSAREYIDVLGVDIPVILHNGSSIIDGRTGEVVHAEVLPDTARHYIQVLMEAFPGLSIEVHEPKVMHVVRTNPELDAFLENERVEVAWTAFDDLPSQWMKVSTTWDAASIQKAEAFVLAQGWNDVTWLRSGEFYLELLPKEVSKGSALKVLADRLGVDMTHTAAVGDYANDLEMLRVAGVSFAPENATAEVKATAGKVVGHCSEGILETIVRELIARG